MKEKHKIYFFCENTIRVISGCILFFLAAANFIFSSYVENGTERVSIETNEFTFFLAAAVCFGACFLFSRIAGKINEKALFAAGASAILLAGIFLIINADELLRFDQLYVYETAMELLENDYGSVLKGGYLSYFPHQLGMVTYERAIGLFSKSTKVIFFFNLLEVIGINFYLWRLTDLFLGHDHVVNVNTIFLSFLFLPQLFFILFAYGLVPGFFFMMAAFFYGAKSVYAYQRKYLVYMLLFSCLSVFLKENYLIGTIALAIWLFLKFLEKREYRVMLCALLLLPCCLLFGKAARGICGWESGVTMEKGVPVMLYIGMGVNINNEAAGPGWFDGSNWSYYTQCGMDYDTANDLAGQLMQSYFEEIKKNPPGAMKFFVRKSVSIWCDPLFQSVWSGPQEKSGQYMGTDFLRELYNDGKPENVVYHYMKGYMLVLLAMSLLFLIREWRKNEDMALLLLFMIGGFLFHLFWEAKSQYMYPYAFVLIPLCAYMMAKLSLKKENAVGRLQGSR